MCIAALFQTPVVPTSATCKNPAGIGFPCASPRPQVQNLQGFTTTSQTPTPTPYVSSHISLTPLPCRSTSPIVSVTSVTAPVASTTFRQSPSPNAPLPYATSHSPGVLQVRYKFRSILSGSRKTIYYNNLYILYSTLHVRSYRHVLPKYSRTLFMQTQHLYSNT